MNQAKLQFDPGTVQRVIQKIGQIDQYKGTWNVLEKTDNRYLRELRRIATIQSIGSSTRIEGSSLEDKEIETLLKNLKISKLQTRDEQEVVGYYNVLETIVDSYLNIELSVPVIHGLHNLLLKQSDKDTRHRGKYKELTNKVVATYPDGTTKIVFRTTEPFLVEKEMSELVDWTREQLEKSEMHPLIVIAAFVYEFLSIHPYQDGNGRLSRLLTSLLLLKNGYSFVLYISLEHIIERRKKEYYQALMEGQKNRYSENERIDTWTLFFLDCLLELVGKLETKLAGYKVVGGYLNDRQKKVVQFIADHQPVKLNDVVKALDQYSVAILRKDLQYLVQEYVLEKVGRNRGTVYFLGKKL